MNYINETGISFNSGEQLTAFKLQTLNNRINELINAVNNILKGSYDVNLEIKDFSRKLSLSEAINLVSKNRRSLGMKIRYLALNDCYAEYSYIGTTLEDSDWMDENNWSYRQDNIVDGGEF